MSVKKASNKTTGQPDLVTTGRGAAVAITAGITLLILGLAFLISQLSFAADSLVLQELSQALQGLGGPLCAVFPVLLCWGGVKLVVSARHHVSGRDFWLVFLIYVLLLAGHALVARVQQSGAPVAFMDFVGRENYRRNILDFDSFTAYLQEAYSLRVSGAGGLIGMLVAYPVWRILGTFFGAAMIAILLIVLIFVLFRINPGALFRSAEEKSEQRRLKKMQRQSEQAQAQETEAPPKERERKTFLGHTIRPVEPSESPAQEEPQTPPPADFYPPAPVYAYPPSQQPVQNKGNKGFYAVNNDLYEEYIPVNPPQTAQEEEFAPQPEEAWNTAGQPIWGSQAAENEPFEWQSAAVPTNEPQSVYKPEKKAEWKHTKAEEKEQPRGYSKPEFKQQATIRQDETNDDLPWETPQRPPEKPVYTAAAQPSHAETSHVAAKQPEPQAVYSAPAPTKAEKHTVAPASDWASQVRRKEAELSGDLPDHTTARGEAKPVYTDPVMPITNERVPIAPRRDDAHPDAKLDGTLAPKPQQGRMALPIAYQAPPIRLLNESRQVPQTDAAQDDERRAQIIEGTLGSFGVEAEVKQIMHGPSITRFAIQIAPGVKVSRVTNTAENLALDLKTQHVRVEAPIQGTSYIGIEVPNKLVSTVSLREVLDSPEMRNNPSPLLVALGKDIAGSPILCDLSKMPHLLIAGATGSGKSVCINSIICSLLYRTSPSQVRLIMIDPKQVELSVYNCIPHLLIPVVSDPRKASGALSWVVQEMLERYGKFSEQGVRSLAAFNKVNQGTDRVLPNIVVIIDEMADLMEVCRKDVEESIRRLAALARAAGIYMVLATQRPSVDVITGVIKNNIPSRIAFAVSSGTDSRTIIDINGAEKLMGKGDMLYKPVGASPIRVQGCLVTDDEVNAIADYIATRYETGYDPSIIEHLEEAGNQKMEADEIGREDEGVNGGEEDVDDLLVEAIEMAVEDGQTSTSMLQRRLRIGYARAGRLVDEMAKRGIVSQSEGSKPRKTLITREQYYEMFSDS